MIGIFKFGKFRFFLSSYCLISLFSVFGKIYECFIYKCFKDYVEVKSFIFM